MEVLHNPDILVTITTGKALDHLAEDYIEWLYFKTSAISTPGQKGHWGGSALLLVTTTSYFKSGYWVACSGTGAAVAEAEALGVDDVIPASV